MYRSWWIHRIQRTHAYFCTEIVGLWVIWPLWFFRNTLNSKRWVSSTYVCGSNIGSGGNERPDQMTFLLYREGKKKSNQSRYFVQTLKDISELASASIMSCSYSNSRNPENRTRRRALTLISRTSGSPGLLESLSLDLNDHKSVIWGDRARLMSNYKLRTRPLPTPSLSHRCKKGFTQRAPSAGAEPVLPGEAAMFRYVVYRDRGQLCFLRTPGPNPASSQ